MAKKDKAAGKQSKTGRPRKFEGPTQNFYVTLPAEVVQQLKAVDNHLATAIVKVCAGAQIPAGEPLNEGILPVVVGLGAWVLSVPDAAKIPGVRLVPHSVGRWLLALEPDQDLRDLELLLRDFLEKEETSAETRALVEELVNTLSRSRRQGGQTTLQLVLCQEKYN